MDPYDGVQNGRACAAEMIRDAFDPKGFNHRTILDWGGDVMGNSYETTVKEYNAQKFGICTWQAHGAPTFAQNVMSTENIEIRRALPNRKKGGNRGKLVWYDHK